MQSHYETIFIMRPTLNDQEIPELIENYRSILSREGADLLDQQDLGKKKLAYSIRHFQNGHYAIFRYTAPPAAVQELERSMKINEDVLRAMSVKLDDKEIVAAEAATTAARAAAKAAEAAAAEAATAAAKAAEAAAAAPPAPAPPAPEIPATPDTAAAPAEEE